MPELRQDPITLNWVSIAIERAKRPHTFTQVAKVVVKAPDDCPFCYNHEGETPKEVMAYRPASTAPDSPGWKVRVVPNLYAAFGPSNGDLKPGHVGPYTTMAGLGVHEVLINAPDHYKSLAQLPLDQVALVVRAYVDRYLAHKDNDIVKYMLVIVNHGREAGMSREHPHAQLFGIPLVPKNIAEEIEGTRRHKREQGTCVFCDVINYETKAKERLIYENDMFLVFAPFASRVPFESWVIPKVHSGHFEAMTEREQRSFADALRTVLAKLHYGLNDPPLNYYIHTTPYRDNVEGLYHWHVEILPKLSIAAGFELGSGVMINTALPESAAEFLRKVSVEEAERVKQEALSHP